MKHHLSSDRISLPRDPVSQSTPPRGRFGIPLDILESNMNFYTYKGILWGLIMHITRVS